MPKDAPELTASDVIEIMQLLDHDLAPAKPERNNQRDRNDLKHLARTILFDLDALKDRYRKELRPLLGNLGREDLTRLLWVEAIEEDRHRAGCRRYNVSKVSVYSRPTASRQRV
jgi:hypothetical protein